MRGGKEVNGRRRRDRVSEAMNPFQYYSKLEL